MQRRLDDGYWLPWRQFCASGHPGGGAFASTHHVPQAARLYERPVAVCGEIAADARYGPLLVGLGVSELSVSPPAQARVKEALFQHELSYWQSRAHGLLQAETAVEIEELLADL